MTVLRAVLNSVSFLLGAYSILCVIRIFITWSPRLAYSKFAQGLANICDPFFNLFKGIKWLHFGALDFSPALALCVINGLQVLTRQLALMQQFSLGILFAIILNIIWSTFASIFIFLIILLFIRWIIELVNKNGTQNMALNAIDRAISSMIFKITGIFIKKPVSYKKALGFTAILFLLLLIIASIVISLLTNAIMRLPF